MAEFITLLKKTMRSGNLPDYKASSSLMQRLLSILNSAETGKIKIVGQPEMNRRLVCALILNEHILLEGLPGVAKTTAVKNLAAEAGLFFKRVQFIPDMQPSDLIGKRDIEPKKDGDGYHIDWKHGPLFSNLVLADEINRAPAKVQAALLEAMGEKQITPFGRPEEIILHPRARDFLAGHTLHNGFAGTRKIDVDDKASTQFSVFATMNPIEIEGTYPLSEAQIDRFCFKTIVHFPDFDDLFRISAKVFQTHSREWHPGAQNGRADAPDKEDFILALYFLQHCRKKIFEMTPEGECKHIDEKMIKKIAQIVYFSNYKYEKDGAVNFHDREQVELQTNMRKPEHERALRLLDHDEFLYIQSGSSPRGLEALLRASLCEAFLDGAGRVNDAHVRKAAYDVLRHRIRLKIQAKTQNITPVDIIDILLDTFLDDHDQRKLA